MSVSCRFYVSIMSVYIQYLYPKVCENKQVIKNIMSDVSIYMIILKKRLEKTYIFWHILHGRGRSEIV